MPYRTEWVEPEVFLEHDGRTVYCTYDDDEADGCVMTYWYSTLATAHSEDPEWTFDVRDLDNPNGHDPETDEGRRAIIREAIDRDDPVLAWEDDEDEDESDDE